MQVNQPASHDDRRHGVARRAEGDQIGRHYGVSSVTYDPVVSMSVYFWDITMRGVVKSQEISTR
jgi:hypothetical protein